jgi:hypothetical protein
VEGVTLSIGQDVTFDGTMAHVGPIALSFAALLFAFQEGWIVEVVGGSVSLGPRDVVLPASDRPADRILAALHKRPALRAEVKARLSPDVRELLGRLHTLLQGRWVEHLDGGQATEPVTAIPISVEDLDGFLDEIEAVWSTLEVSE